MKRLVLVLCVLAAGLAAPLFGQRVGGEGKLWLDANRNPVEVNVNGTWVSKDWGKIILSQNEGAREIIGKGDGWNVLGVVSGNKVYLIFAQKDRVAYSAELTAESPNTLNGGYCRGLLFPGAKTKRMFMTR
jgi:hypothetical protein